MIWHESNGRLKRVRVENSTTLTLLKLAPMIAAFQVVEVSKPGVGTRPAFKPDIDLVPAAPTDDADDATRAAGGDVDAFERLYHRHARRVRATARWLLGTSDVDDAVQEVFIRLWRKIHLYGGASSFGTWFSRLTVNVVLRVRAQTHRHVDGAVSADGLTNLAAPTLQPDWGLDLESAVAVLPRRAREVFVLHDVQGMDHEEIGKLLGITASTSRSQLMRARIALRHWFGDEVRDSK